MMAGALARYNGLVHEGWRRGAIVSLLASFFSLALAVQARADEQIEVGPTPVLNVHVNHGKVTIQTWDRQQVQVSSTSAIDVRHLDPDDVDPRIPKQMQMASQKVTTDHGVVTLPAESFVLPMLPGSQHDAVLVRGSGPMTITVPRNTAMIIAHVRGGQLTVNNYNGVFVAHTRAAGISLNGVTGTGFVESLRGRIDATNSTFERLRVRTATGNMLFENCTSHQIQASSTYGSIVYDNGDFQPGLARFESEHGDVALGVRGGAQIGAHSGSGHVVSNFEDQSQVRGDPTTKQATVGGGGPAVTATSKNGTVFLYNGSMNDHPHVQQELNGSARLPFEPFPPTPVAAPRQQPQRPHPPAQPPFALEFSRLEQKSSQNGDVELEGVLQQHGLFAIAAGLEETLRLTAVDGQRAHLVAVVVVCGLPGGLEQLAPDATTAMLLVHDDALDVSERGGDANRRRADRSIAVARGESVELLVPNDGEAIGGP